MRRAINRDKNLDKGKKNYNLCICAWNIKTENEKETDIYGKWGFIKYTY